MPAVRNEWKRPWVLRAATCAAVFMMLFFLALEGPAAAGDLKVVRGIVGTVSGSHLFMNGGSVDLSGVMIRDHTGKEIFISEITPGTKVGLYYQRGTLMSVLVYPPMVE